MGEPIFVRLKPVQLLILALLAIAGLAAGLLHHRSEKKGRLNVLLLVADTLRADHLGSYGYPKNTSPRLDRLAGESVLFENAAAHGPWTKPSMGSLFTSSYPHNHSAMSNLFEILPEEAVTMAEVLQKNGYKTMAIQTNPSLSKPFNFDQGIEEYKELVMDNLKDKLTVRRAEEVVDHFFEWADKNRRQPFFSYLHFMDNHLPFEPPEEHRILFESSYEGTLLPDRIKYEQLFHILDMGPRVSQADKDHIVALYDGTIHYLDSQIGRLLDGLAERGLLDRTLIVFVSDHGEEFFEHGSFDHGHSLYNELLHVPLILSDPTMERKPFRVRQLVRLIDVFPTVLSILGITPPPGLLGEDLTPLFSGQETDWKLAAYSEGISFHKGVPGRTADDFISVSKNGFKLIQQKIEGKRVLEFYDLRTDPKELSPIKGEDPRIGEYEILLEQHRTLGRDLRRSEVNNKEESDLLKRLKSLGYLH